MAAADAAGAIWQGRMLKSRLADAAPQAAQLPRGCRLLWAAAPGLTIGWLLLLVARGLLPVASVYLTRPLVNRLLRAIDAKGSWETVQPVLILVALVALVMVAGEILAAVGRWIRTVQSETVQDYVSGLIHTRSVTLDLAFFESAEFFDRLHRARAEAGSRSIALLENGGQLLQNGITLLAMGAVLIPFGLWLPAALVLSTAPALYVVVRTNLDQHRWWLRTTPDTRRADYFDWVLTAPEFAAEIRLFGLGDYFQGAYQKLRRQLRDERTALVRSQSLAELGAGALGFIVFGLAVAAMVWRAVLGQITLGDLALFYQAFDQGQRLLRSLLESLGQAYANSLFLGGLFEFLDLEPRLAAPADPTPTPATVAREVRFRRVSFRYPRSRRPVLRELELSVRAGQVAAIVGPNGTGKSTLTKLLCRLYDPDEGSVELDGTDLRQLPIDELRRMISVVFQVP
ncbi:MAG TPA: ABC transporter ATP-binding protein, partial [Chloroflexota bacterium]|nr:ABC transporter ATP-binding protein [Chloroflexota bacterium]